MQQTVSSTAQSTPQKTQRKAKTVAAPAVEGDSSISPSISTPTTLPTTTPPPTLSSIPEEIRKYFGVDLQDIAKAVGKSPATITRLFSTDNKQKRDTSFKTAVKIARFLKISLDDLAAIVHEGQ